MNVGRIAVKRFQNASRQREILSAVFITHRDSAGSAMVSFTPYNVWKERHGAVREFTVAHISSWRLVKSVDITLRQSERIFWFLRFIGKRRKLLKTSWILNKIWIITAKKKINWLAKEIQRNMCTA